jgi:hypothetical protein
MGNSRQQRDVEATMLLRSRWPFGVADHHGVGIIRDEISRRVAALIDREAWR